MSYFLRFFSVIILTSLIACSSAEDTSTYFGGKIINPKATHVILKKENQIIDTLFLDKNNRFLKQFDSIKEGLYSFSHGIEFQYVYLKPKDSVMIRLNTWDFDKSLVFSGKGCAKNEFLLQILLDDEHLLSKINPYFAEEEIVFEKKIDSLQTKRQQIYHQFLEKEENTSDTFKKIASIAINYPLYRLKELYPLYYRNILHKHPTISKQFYNFRSDIDFSLSELSDFHSYQNYTISYIYNVGYLKKELLPNIPITIHYLTTIAQDISAKKLRNELLYKYTVTDIFNKKPYCSIDDGILELFYKKCSDTTLIKKLKNILDDCQLISKNNLIPNFRLSNFTNRPLQIQPLIKNRNTVLYFWSTATASPYYLINRIQFLEKKFPSILFLGINTDANFDLNKAKSFSRLPLQRQFKLTENPFLKSKLPRVIILTKEGKVAQQFISLSNAHLEKELFQLSR